MVRLLQPVPATQPRILDFFWLKVVWMWISWRRTVTVEKKKTRWTWERNNQTSGRTTISCFCVHTCTYNYKNWKFTQQSLLVVPSKWKMVKNTQCQYFVQLAIPLLTVVRASCSNYLVRWTKLAPTHFDKSWLFCWRFFKDGLKRRTIS